MSCQKGQKCQFIVTASSSRSMPDCSNTESITLCFILQQTNCETTRLDRADLFANSFLTCLQLFSCLLRTLLRRTFWKIDLQSNMPRFKPVPCSCDVYAGDQKSIVFPFCTLTEMSTWSVHQVLMHMHLEGNQQFYCWIPCVHQRGFI